MSHFMNCPNKHLIINTHFCFYNEERIRKKKSLRFGEKIQWRFPQFLAPLIVHLQIGLLIDPRDIRVLR